MTYYRTTGSFETLKNTVILPLLNPFKNKIGFMYRDNEIIICSPNQDALEIIRSHYNLTECELPNKFFEKDRRWGYFGDQSLFEPIL
jgi:hypothetical protein